MMKKKIKNQEEILQKNLDKTIENKETTLNPEINNPEESDITLSDNSKESESVEEISGESAADKVVPEIRAMEEKLAEMQDKYIRLCAEFDNYRKRTLREKMDLSKYAGEEVFLKIIPIMDDFERALKHMDLTTECEAMKSGIDLIYNKFTEFLRQNGIKEIESINNIFNVDLHEAVSKVPVDEEDKKGKVIDVVLKGYYLQDKILRFSKVVVGE
jgi:molecular chaperone GrpE